MARVYIAYEDGFADDTVVLRVDGREVARQAGLKSSLATALAATADAVFDTERGTLQASVPARGLESQPLAVDFAAQPYLAVAIREGRLVLRASHEAFVYF